MRKYAAQCKDFNKKLNRQPLLTNKADKKLPIRIYIKQSFFFRSMNIEWNFMFTRFQETERQHGPSKHGKRLIPIDDIKYRCKTQDNRVTHCLSACLTDWLTDWLTNRFSDWLMYLLADWMTDWLSYWPTCWLIYTDWLTDLTDWMTDLLAYWPSYWLI